MAELKLIFSGHPALELVEVRFSHPLLGREVASYRGKVPGINRLAGSFHLSASVIALVELALRTKLASLIPGFEPFLQGERGSSAASLEQAINKPPRWLDEMFGCDSAGNSLTRRLFDRTNPGMKRPGPVALKFREEQLTGSQITVFDSNVEISDAEALQMLLSATSPVQSGERRRTENLAQLLQPFYVEETISMLRATEIFSKLRLKQQVASIYENPSFASLAGPAGVKLEGLLSQARMRDRLGLRRITAALARPITIAVGGNNGTVLALLEHMKANSALPLQTDFDFPYAVPLVNDLLGGRMEAMPDVCVAGIAPAAKLLRDPAAEYVPVFLAPRMTHRVVARNHSRAINSGAYHLVTEEPTTGSFYFDELQRTDMIHRSAIDVTHVEPDEAFEALQQDDARSVLWFPHYHILRHRLSGVFLDHTQIGITDQPCIFFFHRRFAETREALAFESAIRNAWLEMIESRDAVRTAVGSLLADPHYLRFISRTSGLSRE